MGTICKADGSHEMASLIFSEKKKKKNVVCNSFALNTGRIHPISILKFEGDNMNT